MIIKLIKSIPKLTKASLNTQAVNLINVVKASFDIPKEYKEHIAPLQPHFAEMMYDLYRDCMYEACEAGTQCLNKELAIQAIEGRFQEKSEKAILLLSDTSKIFEALKSGLDFCYEAGKKESTETPLTVLEQSVEMKLEEVSAPAEPAKDEPSEPVLASIDLTSDTINNMINYVNKLTQNDKTALVYALGLVKYVDQSSLKGTVKRATAEALETVQELGGSSPVFNDLVPTEKPEESVQVETLELAAGPMVGMYSIEILKEKLESIVKSHKFDTDSQEELAVVDTLVCKVSELTIDELSQMAADKLCIECPSASDVESLMDFLDEKADLITNAIGLPVTLIFIIKDDCLVLAACFTKHDVAKMMDTYVASAAHDSKTQAPISLSVKKEIEALANLKSLSGSKMKDLKAKAPRMAQYVACVMADFRNGKSCAWTMANTIKKSMKELIESCYGTDASMYYEHLKGNK